jgi:hypothetical protein
VGHLSPPPGRHLVALRHLILEGEVNVRKRFPIALNRPLQADEPVVAVRIVRIVVHDMRRDQRVQALGLPWFQISNTARAVALFCPEASIWLSLASARTTIVALKADVFLHRRSCEVAAVFSRWGGRDHEEVERVMRLVP